MKRSRLFLTAMIILAVSVISGGCASTASQICRPDPLLHPEIRFDDSAHRNIFDDHVFFSKEASGGGRGLGGGGCGCN